MDEFYWDDEKKKNIQWKLPDDLPEELKEFVFEVKNDEKKDHDDPDYYYYKDDPDYHYCINSQKFFSRDSDLTTSVVRP